MKITYLKTIGFRKFENEFETDLFDVTSILGQTKATISVKINNFLDTKKAVTAAIIFVKIPPK